jgi:RNA polymerase sigma-70 factor, ECF subfamily
MIPSKASPVEVPVEKAAAGASGLALRFSLKEPTALAEVYDLFGRRVFSVVMSIVHDQSAAEDLVQETFVRAWRRPFTGNENHALGKWLFTVARNLAIDHIRSAVVRMERNRFDFGVFEQADPLSDAEGDMVSADSARLVHLAILGLTANQIEVIRLAYYDGLSQSEIAKRLGQPLGTVKSWARSALRHLRKSMRDPDQYQ